jgi:transposase InsO family protein
MREAGLCARQRRRFKPATTVADPEGPVFPDLIGQDFNASGTNLRWVGDITYLQTSDGFEYLATVIDLFSRRVIGWAIGADMTAALTVRALEMAVNQRRPEPGVIFHSDRGCQYTSSEFRAFCQANGVSQSMGRTGCCYDNAAAETFFHSLKVEWLHGHEIMDRREIRFHVLRYIEAYYNRKRRHSTLGYLSPCAFESQQSLAGRHQAPPRSAAQRAPDSKPGDTSNPDTPGHHRNTAVRPPARRLVPEPPGDLPPTGTKPLYHQPAHTGKQP